MPHTDPYAVGLDKNPANYTPLTPTSFLERAARVYPDRISMISWQLAGHLEGDLCPLPPAGLSIEQARHRQERHRGGHGA